jgi:hypothetical protein
MTTVAEVQAAITTLTADLETDSAAALAEFTKLEAEIAAGGTPELEGLKTALEALDTRVKGAASEIPTE